MPFCGNFLLGNQFLPIFYNLIHITHIALLHILKLKKHRKTPQINPFLSIFMRFYSILKRFYPFLSIFIDFYRNLFALF